MTAWKYALAALAMVATQPLVAQMEPVPARAADEGEGPFGKLLIRGATVIEGSGARRRDRSTSWSKAIASLRFIRAAPPPPRRKTCSA